MFIQELFSLNLHLKKKNLRDHLKIVRKDIWKILWSKDLRIDQCIKTSEKLSAVE